jgi:kanamycin kinase
VTAGIARLNGAVFAKWNPVGGVESLAAEAERMRWLERVGSVPVPRVLAEHRDAAGELLVTAAIPAVSIASPAGRRAPEAAAAALGTGLRLLHAIDPASCPFPAPDWAALESVDEPVVGHGDPCAPNTLIARGAFAGLVDLGRVGVTDRWADLAIASWSLEWNGLEAAEPSFWRAYGVERDAARMARWRALWEPPAA